jgi:hypothetical protein
MEFKQVQKAQKHEREILFLFLKKKPTEPP